jgi:hypothetical protein
MRRSRQELRARLVEEGREILLTEGLAVGSSNLTFKRVFERLEAKTGMRITNASVIKRIWENQAGFQADVLVTIARDEARRAQGMGQRVITLLGVLDMTTPESRSRALREVCRVEGNASSTAIDQSTNWPLWISVVGIATSTAKPRYGRGSKEPLQTGTYRSLGSGVRTSSLSPTCSDFGSVSLGRWTSSAWRQLPLPRDAHFVN